MTSFSTRSVLVLVLGLSLGFGVQGHRYYLKRLPNFDKVPCVNDYETCYGSGIDEAFGHHDASPQAEVNDFGDEMEELGGSYWSEAFCLADVDGDGFSNGEELGDPCCVWNMESALPKFTTGISHPVHASSTPANPASVRCSVTAAAPAVALTSVGDTWAQFAVTFDSSTSCFCSLVVTAAPTSGGSAPVSLTLGSDGTAVVCGLSAATDYTVSVAAANLAGSTPGAATVSATTTNSGATTPPSACTSSVSFLPAGSIRKSWVQPFPASLMSVGPAAVVFIVFGIVAQVWWISNPKSLYWSCQRPFKSGFLHKYTPSLPFFIGLLLTAVVFVLVGLMTHTWMASEAYAYDQKLAWSRSIGYVASWCMGVTLLPIPRHNLLVPIFGSSIERLLVIHRVLGWVSVALVWVHGIWMAIGYKDTPMGWEHMFRWSTKDSLNALPGTLSGICLLLLAVFAQPCVRRKSYGLFMATHLLYAPAFLFAVLHTSSGQAFALPAFGLGLVLLVIGLVVYSADFVVRPTKVVSVRYLPVQGRGKDHAVLELEKAVHPKLRGLVGKLPEFLQRWCRFEYHDGQYVFLLIPSLSLLPHPFTISSATTSAHPGRFTLHIASIGKWSDKLAKLCQSAAPASPRAAGGAQASFVEGPKLPTVMVAGPYGRTSIRLGAYKHFLLVAGGVGVTPLPPAVMDLRHRYAADPSSVGSVTVVFSARSAPLVREFAGLIDPPSARGLGQPVPDDVASPTPNMNPAHRILVAAAPVAPEPPSSPGAGAGAGSAAPKPFPLTIHCHCTDSMDGLASLEEVTGWQVKTGRPALPAIMSQVAAGVKAGSADGGHVGVIVCGPQGMIEQTESLALKGVSDHPTVKFHVHKESFEF